MKVLLLGYYGHQNFGDDLLMKLSLDRLRQNQSIDQLGVTCLASGINYAKSLVPYVDRFEDLNNHRKHLQQYDFVIFGGGGTVFEYRKNLSRIYAIKKWLSDFRNYGFSQKSGTRFASIGLGIGPFSDPTGAAIAMNRLKYHSIAFVRDPTSLQIAQDYGVNAILSHDLSFLDLENISAVQQDRKASNRKLCVIIRNYKYGNSKNRYINTLLDWARSLPESEGPIDWLSFQPEYDEPVISVVEDAGFNVWKWDPYSMDIQDAYQRIAESSLMVTARMHGTYVAGMLGIPCVSIGLHPKLLHAANYFENSKTISSDPSLSDLTQRISEVENQWADGLKLPRASNAKNELEQMMDQLNSWIQDKGKSFDPSASLIDPGTNNWRSSN